MPYARMTPEEAATHLHIHRVALEKLINKRDIPFERSAGAIWFRKKELNDWISHRLLRMNKDKLHGYHFHATGMREHIDCHHTFLSELLTPTCIAPEFQARTRSSVLRRLVDIAAHSGMISDQDELLRLMQAREELGSTGLEQGIAMPHPNIHPPWLIMESFIIIARVPAGIHYGAFDGAPSDLFIMPAAHDDRHHVYMLARLALMFNDTDLADMLRDAQDAHEMLTVFRSCEEEVVAKMAKAYKDDRL